jgi:glycosyltransferase involved in cell wall biosynthesis
MRILETCIRYPPARGGGETNAHAVATRLHRRGHEVTVYTSDLATEFPMARLDQPYAEVDGVPVRRFKGHSLPGPFHWVWMPSMRAMLQDRADLIHVFAYGHHTNLWAAKAARKWAVPLVFTPQYHPLYSTTGGAPRKALRSLFDRFLGPKPFRASSLVIALSTPELEWMRPLIPPTTRAVVIPAGIDLAEFQGGGDGRAFRERHQLDGRVLLYTGRLAMNKHLESVISLMPDLVREFPDLTFVAVGEDHGRLAAWKELASRLGVAGRVRFLGHLERAELIEAYRACDAYVLPSDYESFGIVLLEAMACGKPVVATRVGGVPDIVSDRQTGLLVPYGDAPALREALASLLRDEGLRRSLGAAARAAVGDRFDWDSIVRRIEAEYAALLAGKPAGSPAAPRAP